MNNESIGLMPYSGHHYDAVCDILNLINGSGLSVEVFDAFISEYRRTGHLEQSISFAYSEWDL